MRVAVVLLCLSVVIALSAVHRATASVAGRRPYGVALRERSRPVAQPQARQNEESDEDEDDGYVPAVGGGGGGSPAANSAYEQAVQAINKDHGNEAVEEEEADAEDQSEEFHFGNRPQGSAPNPQDEASCEGDDDDDCNGGDAGGGSAGGALQPNGEEEESDEAN